jgi:hypothetical protein
MPRGRRLVARALPGHIRRISTYISVLSAEERRSLTSTLRKLYAALPCLSPPVASGRDRRPKATG